MIFRRSASSVMGSAEKANPADLRPPPPPTTRRPVPVHGWMQGGEGREVGRVGKWTVGYTDPCIRSRQHDNVPSAAPAGPRPLSSPAIGVDPARVTLGGARSAAPTAPTRWSCVMFWIGWCWCCESGGWG